MAETADPFGDRLQDRERADEKSKETCEMLKSGSAHGAMWSASRSVTVAMAQTLSIGVSMAHADWIQTLGLGQKSSSLGGAVTAISEVDFDAFYTNPAGAANFTRPFIGAAVKLLDTRQLQFKDATGSHDPDSTFKEFPLAVLPAVGAYLPGLIPGVTLGIGFGAPAGLAGDWDKTAGIHRFNMLHESLVVTEVSPTVAVKLSDWLNIGAALNVVAFKHLRFDVLIGDNFLANAGIGAPDPGTAPDGTLGVDTNSDFPLPVPPFNEFDPAFDEFGFTVGAQIKATDRLSFGIVYKEELPTTFTGPLTGSLVVDIGGAVFVDAPIADHYSLDLYMPRHVQVGAAFDLIPNILTVSADAQWTNWSDAKGIGSPAVVKFLDDTVVLPALGLVDGLHVPYSANDTVTLRFGAQLRPASVPGLTVLAGYVYDPSFIDDAHVDILT